MKIRYYYPEEVRKIVLNKNPASTEKTPDNTNIAHQEDVTPVLDGTNPVCKSGVPAPKNVSDILPEKIQILPQSLHFHVTLDGRLLQHCVETRSIFVVLTDMYVS